MRRPFSCVPPSGVGTVLQYEVENPSSFAIQATAHSSEPWPPGLVILPEKIWSVTSSFPSMSWAR